MSNTHVATYLKDHDAGSEAALEILDHIERSHGEGAPGQMARTLRPQFIEERAQVKRLLESLGDSTSVPRRMASWLSEKAVRVKLMVDDSTDGPLHLLEAVELLGLGVHGKRCLWVALDDNKDANPVLQMVDYKPLIEQTDAQRGIIELVRLEAARAALR
jgi:hypothetical protein